MDRLLESGETFGDRINADSVKPGDLLIDSVNNNGKAGNYFMGKAWPGLKNGNTVWIDGNAIGEDNDILFRGGQADDEPWGETKDITIRAVPNTQVKAKSFSCVGLLNFKLPGRCKTFPGLASLETKRFLSGNFPFHMKAGPGGHSYNISVLDGGAAEIEGIEGQWGFSNFRWAGGKGDTKQRLKLSNFYLHDTDTGEALYLGETTHTPYAKLILEIFDGFLVRPASEALQVSHSIGSDIHNLTIAAADTAWINNIRAFQDKGIQFQVDAGVNKLYNIIVDGYGSNGLIPMSASYNESIKEALIQKILFNDGRYIGHYLDPSNSFGVKWLMKELFYGAFNNSYTRTGKAAVDYVCSKQHGTDVFTFQNCIYDKTKARFSEDPENGQKQPADKIPLINYMNSGFTEPMSNIMQWKKTFGAYHPVSKDKPAPVFYSKGQIVIDEHKFYKVVNPYTSDKQPKNSENFLPLTWDENGVRSDMVGFNSASKQRDDAPDDLRLKQSDFWRSMGMGYIEPKNMREELFQEWKTKTIEFLNTLK